MADTAIAQALAQSAELIRHKARQLARRRDFLRQDEEDIVQTLTARLLARLPAFDPTTTTLKRFARRVIDQGAANLVRDRHAQMRHDPGSISLDHVHFRDEDGRRMLGVDVHQGQVDDRLGVQRRGELEGIDLTNDLATFLDTLTEEERGLAESLLATGNIAEVARQCGVARSTIYVALGRWRERARKLGLQDYLDNAPTVRPTLG